MGQPPTGMNWSQAAPHLPRPPSPPKESAQLAATGGSAPAPLPTGGAGPGADSEQSVACHGMVFSMDFQETKKETKSKRKNEGAGGVGGKEQNKATEISSLASGLV